MKSKLTLWLEGMSGALRIGFHLLAPWLHGRRIHWGALSAESRMDLPGDDLIPYRQWSYTHAIAIQAPPTAVWPWLAQIGQGRGGFYSYEVLENLIGCRIKNTEQILPEFQSFNPDEGVRLYPQGAPLPVHSVKPDQYLLLYAEVDALTGCPPAAPDIPAKRLIQVTWLFYLAPQPDLSTRLLTRGHYAYARSLFNLLFLGPLLLEPISFVMERKMLLEIKRLVETQPIPAATRLSR